MEQEIFDALLSTGATKAPGPDGFTTIFLSNLLEHYQGGCLKLCLGFLQEKSFVKGAEPYFYCSHPKETGAVLGQSFLTYQFVQQHLQDYLEDFGEPP